MRSFLYIFIAENFSKWKVKAQFVAPRPDTTPNMLLKDTRFYALNLCLLILGLLLAAKEKSKKAKF